MNRRLVADFLLQLQDTPKAEVERELRSFHASRATMAAFQTAVNMKEVGGWNSLAEHAREQAVTNNVYAPITEYAPTEHERQAWAAGAISCDEV